MNLNPDTFRPPIDGPDRRNLRKIVKQARVQDPKGNELVLEMQETTYEDVEEGLVTHTHFTTKILYCGHKVASHKEIGGQCSICRKQICRRCLVRCPDCQRTVCLTDTAEYKAKKVCIECEKILKKKDFNAGIIGFIFGFFIEDNETM